MQGSQPEEHQRTRIGDASHPVRWGISRLTATSRWWGSARSMWSLPSALSWTWYTHPGCKQTQRKARLTWPGLGLFWPQALTRTGALLPHLSPQSAGPIDLLRSSFKKHRDEKTFIWRSAIPPIPISSTQGKLNVVAHSEHDMLLFWDNSSFVAVRPSSLSVYVHQMISGMTLPNAYRGFYFQEARFQVSSFLKNFLLYTFYSITLIYTGIYHVCQKSHHSKTFLLTLYTWRMYIY